MTRDSHFFVLSSVSYLSTKPPLPPRPAIPSTIHLHLPPNRHPSRYCPSPLTPLTFLLDKEQLLIFGANGNHLYLVPIFG